ncbi:conserved hypothetical protein [Histoplasma capsulatum var. duboisii H88]|uniref:Hemerythrin-like domain-containing protein n=3 Tax=Ajellomyces capsulatus TaxID=5037 RepID=C0NM82_AJECG|nr:uncharacterized protein HCBG_04612 [Histoplasma capsulatum G186AR]EEH07733.1 conserved hypothetical protein [Histoplasma capsulatum G186AR]EER36389.1 conserved hypothetical protein [Histoplasma capsulatum H143]EGC41841.1 conserved hypothetical protein [Histoplasma capsulatum var. duboisii H88]QSS51744.1 hypothetical protein I7I53_07148 [Histoplasma capsulatum var. duboisii H88]
MSEVQNTPVAQPAASADPLPELSAEDFEVFNFFAEKMDFHHNEFRVSWTKLYDACVANELPKDMSLEQFIQLGTEFCNNLEIHHSLEEAWVFPILGQRMPAFKDEHKKVELLVQHTHIHTGLTNLLEYLSACKEGKKEFALEDLKAVMDGFREILWVHMDNEVDELRPDKLRKYWSLEEIMAMPFYDPVK